MRPSVLSFLYLVLALPVVLFQVFGTPPFQMPDEPRHFMRALQIADGRLLGRRDGDTFSGGDLETAAQDVAVAFRPLALDSDRRLDPAVLARLAPLRWRTTPKTPALFENTSIYPPTFYAPAALAIRTGKAIDLPILWTYYLARLTMGLTGLGLATLAIHLCDRGRTVLFVALSLPLALSAFASLSQDGVAIAAGALAVALWSRSLAADRPMPLATRAVAALLLGAVVGARLPLLPLLALLLLPTDARSGLRPRTSTLLVSALSLLPVGFSLVCAAAAKVPFRVADGVAPDRQMAFVLHAPTRAFGALSTTLEEHAGEFLREMVSVLGWWSGMLPSVYYAWIALCLVGAVAIDILGPRDGFARWAKLVTVALAIAASLGVFVSFYLAWTPVGGPVIEGVQGRYFIVPTLVLCLALPRFAPRATDRLVDPDRRPLAVAQVVLCAAVGLFNLWAVPYTILSRYYL